MDRRLLLVPASALFAHAQSSPEAVAAEQALRARVEEFYKLQQGGKFRQAEAYVAEESKEDYYNGRKQEVRDFTVDRVQLLEGGTRAKVVVKAKMVMLFAGAQEVVMATESTWKLDGGKWSWFLDPAMKNLTPFGMMVTGEDANGVPAIKGLDMTGKAPELNEILNKIAIDRTAFVFSREERVFTATITNGTAGPLTLTLDPHVAMIKSLEVSIDNTRLDAGQKATVLLKWTATEPFTDEVAIRVDPYLRNFTLRVAAK